MIFIWSGVGLLVPAIAVISYFLTSMLFGKFCPESGVEFLSFLATTIALAAAGLLFRKWNMRRHLYFIPMEYWSIASGIAALAVVPKMFGA